jgi:hypothetical protein
MKKLILIFTILPLLTMAQSNEISQYNNINLKMNNYYIQNERAYHLLLTGVVFTGFSVLAYTKERNIINSQYATTYFFGTIGAGFTGSSIIVKLNSKKKLK